MIKNHIVYSYDVALDSVHDAIREMGHHLDRLLALCIQAFSDLSHNYTEEARALDRPINHLDLHLEEEATVLLALRQPMGRDLRILITALKAGVMLERMGDLSKNVVKRAARIGTDIDSKDVEIILTMLRTIQAMLQQTMEAFANADRGAVYSVCMMDDIVDTSYHALLESMQQHIMEDATRLPSIMHAIFAMKNIERVGDYVTKLARLVYYIVSGERAPKMSEMKRSPISRLDSDDDT